MSTEADQRCSVCGQVADPLSPVPGAGSLCDGCLLAGRFLGSTGALSLTQAAKRLPELSQRIRKLIDPAINEAARLADRKHNDTARGVLLDAAGEQLRADRPLLAAFLLQSALQIPGNSSPVYAGLGDAAAAMDCTRDATQHFKTAGWLAMQQGDRAGVERSVAGLRAVSPNDSWIRKAEDWLGGKETKVEPRCGFCGKPESEVGALIAGPQAAICSACLKRLAANQDA